MEDIINKLTEVDGNFFWSVVTMLLIPTVVPTVGFAVKKWEIRGWKVAKKVEGESFYGIILLYALFGSIFSSFLFIILRALSSMPFLLHFIILVLVEWFSLSFIHKRKFVRLRIRFGYARIKILLINIPIIILYSTVFFIIFEKLDSVIASIVVVLVLITEICGLIIFQGRYTRFEYAYANLTFKTADPLLRVNVDKILERGKWIIIEQNNCKLKILQDDLLQIEYFGRAKYVFHKESLKIKSPILKKALDQLEYLLDISKHLDKRKNAKLQKLSKS